MNVESLTKEEKMSFMKVIYSLILHNDKIPKWEQEVIDSLNFIFSLSKNDLTKCKVKLYPDSVAIAKEINKINDERSRYYLIRIIWDIFKQDDSDSWFGTIDDKDRNFFNAILESVELSRDYQNKLKNTHLV